MSPHVTDQGDFARAELDQLWVAQLYKEHKEINWYHKANLGTVIIKISEMTSAWGKWEPFFRTISINRKLILEHSWDVVLEVLKHEMAHQYVTDHLRLSHDMSHGEPFKSACKILGVSGWAARASGEIPERIPSIRERVLSPEDERLLSRAEKLLSLAQSANEHEAILAMQRVRELYAKHNFEKIRANRDAEDMDSLYLTKGKKRTEPTESKILSILNDHFQVKVIHTRLYCARKCEQFAAAEILGRRENILMAEFVYHFLSQQIESLWKNEKQRTKCGGRLRRSYQLGVLSGFDSKLANDARNDAKKLQDLGFQPREVGALLVKENRDLEDYVDQRHPRLTKRSWLGGHLDSNAFHSGQAAGRNLNLNKPIASAASRFGGYLT